MYAIWLLISCCVVLIMYLQSYKGWLSNNQSQKGMVIQITISIFDFSFWNWFQNSFSQRGGYPNIVSPFWFQFQILISIFVFSSYDNKIITYFVHLVNIFFSFYLIFFMLRFNIYNVCFFYFAFPLLFWIYRHNALFAILSDFLCSMINYLIIT